MRSDLVLVKLNAEASKVHLFDKRTYTYQDTNGTS
jgi:hypothetical protein